MERRYACARPECGIPLAVTIPVCVRADVVVVGVLGNVRIRLLQFGGDRAIRIVRIAQLPAAMMLARAASRSTAPIGFGRDRRRRARVAAPFRRNAIAAEQGARVRIGARDNPDRAGRGRPVRVPAGDQILQVDIGGKVEQHRHGRVQVGVTAARSFAFFAFAMRSNNGCNGAAPTIDRGFVHAIGAECRRAVGVAGWCWQAIQCLFLLARIRDRVAPNAARCGHGMLSAMRHWSLRRSRYRPYSSAAAFRRLRGRFWTAFAASAVVLKPSISIGTSNRHGACVASADPDKMPV